jgi:DNA-binding response OmpR family regulator
MTSHILVVNDTQEILELFVSLLTDEGYRVSTHSYTTQEIDLVRKLHPDLVIVDYPPATREEQGWQLIQKLKMSPDTASLPLIVCTTNMRAVRDTEGWLAAKNILVVPKPFVIEELLHAVRIQLGQIPNEPPPRPPGS